MAQNKILEVSFHVTENVIENVILTLTLTATLNEILTLTWTVSVVCCYVDVSSVMQTVNVIVVASSLPSFVSPSAWP
jgi:hypothetical protein